MKGLVLAAGLGTRLRPITSNLPKPLVPIFGVPALQLAINRLLAAGIEEIAVNTSYLPEKINELIENQPRGSFHVTFEDPILETGGALNLLQEWLGTEDLIITNGDIVTDLDLGKLIQFHRLNDSIATMASLPQKHEKGRALWTRGGQLVDISEKRLEHSLPFGFTGIHIVSSKLRSYLAPNGSFSIIDTYLKALRNDEKISVLPLDCTWEDIGSPKGLFHTHRNISNKLMDLGVKEANAFGFCERDLDSLYLSENIRNGIKIRPPAFIKGKVSGPFNHIGPYVFIHDEFSSECNSTPTEILSIGASHLADFPKKNSVIYHSQLLSF